MTRVSRLSASLRVFEAAETNPRGPQLRLASVASAAWLLGAVAIATSGQLYSAPEMPPGYQLEAQQPCVLTIKQQANSTSTYSSHSQDSYLSNYVAR